MAFCVEKNPFYFLFFHPRKKDPLGRKREREKKVARGDFLLIEDQLFRRSPPFLFFFFSRLPPLPSGTNCPPLFPLKVSPRMDEEERGGDHCEEGKWGGGGGGRCSGPFKRVDRQRALKSPFFSSSSS